MDTRDRTLVCVATLLITVVGATVAAGTIDARARAGVPDTSLQLAADGLSDETAKELAANGVNVDEPEDGASETASLTSSQAKSRAFQEFGSFVAGKEPSELGLVSLTLEGVGKELELDPNEPSRIAPLAQDRLAWGIVFNDIELPVFGSVDKEGDPSTYTARFAIFIDAATGQFLVAESL